MADTTLGPKEAIDYFVGRLNDEISNQIRLLLEEKHLYQKVKIDRIEELRTETLRRVPKEGRDRELVASNIETQLRHHLVLTSGGPPTRVSMEGGPKSVLCLNLPIVRLFCHTCKKNEAFAPVWYQDATNEMLKLRRDEQVGRNFDFSNIRLYFVAYQCQYCEGAPEGFLVRKTGWIFSLDGRSPMEHIELPAYIPTKEQSLYRDGLIASYAGKQLAAVFYLRCFIEQFARRQTGMLTERKTGDEIMGAYTQTLSLDKRALMPSLKEWYEKLSEPIHTANEDAAEVILNPLGKRLRNTSTLGVLSEFLKRRAMPDLLLPLCAVSAMTITWRILV
jgi:hypothetical protein